MWPHSWLQSGGPNGSESYRRCCMGDEIRPIAATVTAHAGPPAFHLTSRVASLYGASIRTLARETLSALDAADLSITIEDSGALPYTLQARIEAGCFASSATDNCNRSAGHASQCLFAN
ncbi:MAG: hypothetical protein R2867_03545 [Caldilineaceae bacterium]